MNGSVFVAVTSRQFSLAIEVALQEGMGQTLLRESGLRGALEGPAKGGCRAATNWFVTQTDKDNGHPKLYSRSSVDAIVSARPRCWFKFCPYRSRAIARDAFVAQLRTRRDQTNVNADHEPASACRRLAVSFG